MDANFLDRPYTSHFIALIRLKDEWMLELSQQTMETISFFFPDKVSHIRDIQKSVTMLLPCQGLFKWLPFLLFTALTTVTKTRFLQATQNSDYFVVYEMFNFCASVSGPLAATRTELEIFFQLGFHIFQSLRMRRRTAKKE
jgi:hypothetical protein